jgi:hypothetical protein
MIKNTSDPIKNIVAQHQVDTIKKEIYELKMTTQNIKKC